MAEPKYLTVSQLNDYIHAKFEQDSNLNRRVFLTGEISNFRLRDRHQYFSLKDQNSAISAVMFAREFSQLQFTPEEGMKVSVVGRVSTYTKTGQYQIYLETMTPTGVGQLALALRQLKMKLQAQGLFDAVHKKPLVKYPKKIGVITSPNGAVIRDIIKTVSLRYPIASIVLYPAVVQGDRSAPDLIRQLHRLEQRDDIDTIIIGRGGGSIEDLWPFNNEALARAIYDCPIPVISSVGHETDTTVADYVADQRAATPTAAAEFAVPVLKQVQTDVDQLRQRAIKAYQHQLSQSQHAFDALNHNYIFQNPTKLYERYAQHVLDLRRKMVSRFSKLVNDRQRKLTTLAYQVKSANPQVQLTRDLNQITMFKKQLQTQIQLRMERDRQRYQQLTQSLKQLNPKSIMQKGYSYVTKNGQVLTDIEQVKDDDELLLNLANGQVKVKVLQLRKDDSHGRTNA